MVKLFHHVLFSRVLEQEMRDVKSVHTIRDSCYHKDPEGCRKDVAGGKGDGGGVTANTSKVR